MCGIQFQGTHLNFPRVCFVDLTPVWWGVGVAGAVTRTDLPLAHLGVLSGTSLQQIQKAGVVTANCL